MPHDDFKLEVGDSFLLRNQYGEHLHVIIAESSEDDSASIFLVYLSSADVPYRDTTTIIKSGEHPFVHKDSWVRYQSVMICSRNEIRGLIVEYFDKVNENLLIRIQDGVEKSSRVPERDKQIFHQWKLDRLYRKI